MLKRYCKGISFLPNQCCKQETRWTFKFLRGLCDSYISSNIGLEGDVPQICYSKIPVLYKLGCFQSLWATSLPVTKEYLGIPPSDFSESVSQSLYSFPERNRQLVAFFAMVLLDKSELSCSGMAWCQFRLLSQSHPQDFHSAGHVCLSFLLC